MARNTGNIVFIGLGSNIGDKIENLRKAADKIEKDPFCSVQSLSSFYESKAFGNLEQADFINAVIKINTQHSPETLFQILKKTEKEIGRKENARWGPREIDLDILFYNDLIYSSVNLKIPHKGISERDFVLIPMSEIEPEFVHPEINKKISDICTSVKFKTIINKLPSEASIK